MKFKFRYKLSYQVSRGYKKLLRFKTFFKQPDGKALNYNLVTLCGDKQISMLTLCLKSIAKNFQLLPKVYVFTDENLDRDVCKTRLNSIPHLEIVVISKQECIDYHINNAQSNLVKFATNNPMGLKLAAIMQILDQNQPVLYTDTDVLWYDEPGQMIEQALSKEGFEIAMSEDFQPAYDDELISQTNLSGLYEAPYFCAGILLMKPLSIKRRSMMNDLIALAQERSNHFTEQTILSGLNKAGNNTILGRNTILIRLDDRLNITAKRLPGILARHYIGPVRHLFWRDALWIA